MTRWLGQPRSLSREATTRRCIHASRPPSHTVSDDSGYHLSSTELLGTHVQPPDLHSTVLRGGDDFPTLAGIFVQQSATAI